MRREQKKRRPSLNHEEVKVLLREAKLRNHPYYHIWLLTISLGLRRSELDGLKWTDLNFDHRLIYLCRQHIPGEGEVNRLKGLADRTVAIPAFLIPELLKMKLASTSPYVIDIKCHKWNSGAQAAVLKDFCREIGIKELAHQRLRATHITLAISDGISLGIVKTNVGHVLLSTTNRYFDESGILMRGQTDSLKICVPQDEAGEVLPLKTVK
ncbi:MAG: tyrosine-type recombinase/integrase [Bdellovibrionales bacterium]|nr:tyrosine-type recombinase/integrase [Bdellovibrionales bacterium]